MFTFDGAKNHGYPRVVSCFFQRSERLSESKLSQEVKGEPIKPVNDIYNCLLFRGL